MIKALPEAVPAIVRHHDLDACDVALHVAEAGSGPLMVLLSGWPQTWWSWHKVMPGLAEHFRVLAVDLPGLGGSEAPASGYDTGSIALHLDAVLDAFHASSCILVCHDVGAWVGYAYAAQRPARVGRLVLIDAAIPGLSQPEAYRFSPETARKAWHFYFNYIPDLPELLVVGRERAFLEWLFRTKSFDWKTAFDPAALDAYVESYSAPGRWSSGLGYYRAIFESAEQNQATASEPLTMPVLAVGGDASMGAAMAVSIRQAADDVEGAVIERCGHYVPEERPDELLALLLRFGAVTS